ncbi:MAG: hypothetical protein ABGY41_10975, partial [Candidatus Poribacteria bacterium]
MGRFSGSGDAREALSRIANIHHLEYFDPETPIPAHARLIRAFPASGYAEEARVRIGQRGARTERYDAAVAECDRLLDEHPSSPRVPFALLINRGLLPFNMQNRREAAASYSALMEAHPNTPQAAEARVCR